MPLSLQGVEVLGELSSRIALQGTRNASGARATRWRCTFATLAVHHQGTVIASLIAGLILLEKDCAHYPVAQLCWYRNNDVTITSRLTLIKESLVPFQVAHD